MKNCKLSALRTKINIMIVVVVIGIVAVNAVYRAWAQPPQTTSIYTNGTEDSDMYQNRRITSSEAYTLMQKNPNAIILDVRTRQEFSTGRIPGAVLLPDYQIHEYAESVIPDKDSLVLVYCRSGARSRTAASILVSMGFTNVYDFGGIITWPYGIEK